MQGKLAESASQLSFKLKKKYKVSEHKDLCKQIRKAEQHTKKFHHHGNPSSHQKLKGNKGKLRACTALFLPYGSDARTLKSIRLFSQLTATFFNLKRNLTFKNVT